MSSLRIALISAALAVAGAGCPASEAPKAPPAPSKPATTAGSSTAASRPASKPASGPSDRAGPVAAAQGLGDQGEIRPGPDDRCAVCAMRPHMHPKFASGLELEDGRTFYTCGTGCFLRAYLHPEIYLGATAVKRVSVPDYFTGAAIDARAAFWIAGSDVNGPMGPAPVALDTEASVQTFQRRHGGRHRFQLKDLDDERFEAITGKPAVRR